MSLATSKSNYGQLSNIPKKHAISVGRQSKLKTLRRRINSVTKKHRLHIRLAYSCYNEDIKTQINLHSNTYI